MLTFFDYSKETPFPLLLFVFLAISLNSFLYGITLNNEILRIISLLFLIKSGFLYIFFKRKYFFILDELNQKEKQKKEEAAAADFRNKFPSVISFEEKYSKVKNLLNKTFQKDSLFKKRVDDLISSFRNLFLENLEKMQDMADYASSSTISFSQEIENLKKENNFILKNLDELVKHVILNKDNDEKYKELLASLESNIDLFRKMKGVSNG